MGITLSLALYFIIWWTVLFAVLPIGVRTQDEARDIVPGTPESAPAAPRLARIFLLNTAVATAVFAVVWVVFTYKLIPLEILPGIR